MTIMFNCATDFSFDLALSDCRKSSIGAYHASNPAGVNLFAVVKTLAKGYADTHPAFDRDSFTWVGDAWVSSLDWDWFSDAYKDAYGQRPHWDSQYLAMMVGLPTNGDVAVSFCQSGGLNGWLDEVAEMARETREAIKKRYS